MTFLTDVKTWQNDLETGTTYKYDSLKPFRHYSPSVSKLVDISMSDDVKVTLLKFQNSCFALCDIPID